MREFESGATRDTDEGKPDYEGFLSPLVLKRFAEYMDKNRVQADGNVRDSDNWQKGIPLTAYMKSAWRHFMEWWTLHRHSGNTDEAVCALLFNVMGYLHESIKRRQPMSVDQGHPRSLGSYTRTGPSSAPNEHQRTLPEDEVF